MNKEKIKELDGIPQGIDKVLDETSSQEVSSQSRSRPILSCDRHRDLS